MFTKKLTRFSKIIIVLSFAVVCLSLAHTLHGPKAVSIDTSGQLDQTYITFQFNDILAPKQTPDIHIEPSTKFTASISDKQLVLRFDEPLLYNNTYRVEVSNIHDRRGRVASSSYRFHTGVQKIAYLQRGSEIDQIHTRIVGKPESDAVIFEHERIGDFAVSTAGSVLAVIDENTKTMFTRLLRITDEKSEEITPPKGIALAVTASATKNSFLIRTRDMATLTNYLYRYDWQSNSFEELVKLDGSPIHASHVQFAPDGETILYTDASDGLLYMLDPLAKREPLNFGSVSSLCRVLSANKGILIEPKPGQYQLVQNNGEFKTITEDITINEATMTANGTFIYVTNAYSLTNPSQVVKLMNPSSEIKTVLTFDSSKELERSLQLSPNDELISFNIGSVPNTYDGYRVRPEVRDSSIKIMTLNGQLIDNFSGTHLTWL